jgi:hypothetical protein
MRRALVFLVLLFSFSFAAVAHAQSSGDAVCNEVSPVAVTCTAADKLGEFAGAECRNLGLPVSACALPFGTQVADPAVASYERSWVHRAVAFQYRLAAPLSVLHGDWVGTHNSFNRNDPADPTLSHSDSNQQLTLTEQLDSDVRAIELDVHLINGVATVCHGRGPDEANLGCTTEPPFSAVLPEVASWLKAHPSQVILLYLEDELGGSGYDQVVETLDTQLGAKIYRPDPAARARDGCTPLPDVSRARVRRTGARVVIVGNCAKGWASDVFNWNDVHVESGSTARYRPFPDCDASYPRSVYESKLVRYYEDSTLVATAVSPTTPASDPDRLTAAKARAMSRCGVNLFGFDQLLPHDGRLEATIWSWRRNQPRAGAFGCAQQDAGGRWVSGGCRGRAACQTAMGWTLTARRVPYWRAPRACGAAGGHFALPRTGYANSVLHAAAGRHRVLLRYRLGHCRSPTARRRTPRRCGAPTRRS